MDIGTTLLNLGFILNFIALGFREILWIRILLTLGYLSRFITHYVFYHNINTSIWMIVFVVINMIQIIQIVNERRKRYIEPKIVDLYKSVFNKLTTYEFLTFWKIGRVRTVNDNTTIIKQGEKLNSMILLLSGKVIINKDKINLTFLSRGSFIGEISTITGDLTVANVISEGDVSYIEWDKIELLKIKSSNKIFWIKLQNILLYDLITKIKRSNN